MSISRLYKYHNKKANSNDYNTHLSRGWYDKRENYNRL